MLITAKIIQGYKEHVILFLNVKSCDLSQGSNNDA